MKNLLSLIVLITCLSSYAQGNPGDYYYQIPEYPAEYSGGTVAARVVDGLGFRYYWATEGLRPEDLNYRPSEEARNVEETIDHILGLTAILKDAVNKQPYGGVNADSLSFEEKRALTLQNIRGASEKLKLASNEDLRDFDMIFSSGNQFPFWNLLNGPIADAINHVGQVITLRRTAGNPINQNISVLRGTQKE